MKNYIPCFIFFLLLPGFSYGQSRHLPDTNKYSIHLPDFWKPGNKIWQILNDKLPLVCDELKEKELCGDNCRPAYTIEFEMSEPVINERYPNHISSGVTSQTWDFVTTYSFECSLLLFDEKDKLLTRLILVDTDEVWTVTSRASLASSLPPPPPKLYLRTFQKGVPAVLTQEQPEISYNGTAGQTPFDFINSKKEYLSPERKDMLAIVDRKIRAL